MTDTPAAIGASSLPRYPSHSYADFILHSFLSPGDTLVILPGIYRERVVIAGVRGTADSPITIRGAIPERVVFHGGCESFPCDIRDFNWQFVAWEEPGWDLRWELDGFISIRESDHLILSDLTVRRVAVEGIRVDSSTNVTIQNTIIENTGNGGIIAQYSDDITIRDNHLERVQLGYLDRDGNPAIGYHEALSVIGVSRFSVTGNRLTHVITEGIDVRESSSDGIVQDNVLVNVCAAGIYINEADSVMVTDNRLSQMGFMPGDDGDPVPCDQHPVYGEAFGEFYGDGILLTIGDLDDVSVGLLSDVTIQRNIVDRTRGNCLQTRGDTDGSGIMQAVSVLHNTLVHCGDYGILLDDVRAVRAINNLIVSPEGAPLAGNRLPTAEVAGNVIQTDDLTITPPAGQRFITDAGFVDPDTGDFRLTLDSPAIDAGQDVGLDYAGSAPDAGALEHGMDDA